MDEQNKMLIYTDNDGLTRIDVKLEDDTLWLTQAQMCELYQTSKSNVSEHIKHIFEDGELQQESVVRKFRTTATDGKSWPTNYYNLDMIIALGYRVRSVIATRFRQWATLRLKEYIQKGFTMDDERLKKLGGGGYRKELLERIRDIRGNQYVAKLASTIVFGMLNDSSSLYDLYRNLTNEKQLCTAWVVGGYVSAKLKSEEWGSKVVTRFAEYV